MTLNHPVQKLCGISQGASNYELVLAASGSTISTISLSTRAVLYQWPQSDEDEEDDNNDSNDENGNGGRPNKRRKTTNGKDPISRQQSETSDASIEIVAERRKGERKKSKLIDTKLPNVSHLVVTTSGRYAIVATTEDKAIRVFDITSKGKLTQRSIRLLPKKICALKLTEDEKTILIADKFGDVYALPFHQSEGWTRKEKSAKETPYRPAATELTVHTKRNLEALRQQLEQKENAKKKEGLDFEHQLLLGHVSLLTDLVVAKRIVNGRQRAFILTSDRDEHIRVSRGMTQTHVIESFCLGHTEFVSKLCIPPSRPELLIAGNGEPSLRTYEWHSGRLLQTIAIDSSILPVSQSEGMPDLPEGRTYSKLAVSGIWPMTRSNSSNSGGREGGLILVAFEGLPLLLTYTLDHNGLKFASTTELQGNILDVVVFESEQRLLVSIDNVHNSYSMKSYRDNTDQQDTPFQMLELGSSQEETNTTDNGVWQIVDLPFDISEILQKLPGAPEPPTEETGSNKGYEKVFSGLGELLYGLENLRKKRGSAAEEEEEADVDVEEGETKPEEAEDA